MAIEYAFSNGLLYTSSNLSYRGWTCTGSIATGTLLGRGCLSIVNMLENTNTLARSLTLRPEWIVNFRMQASSGTITQSGAAVFFSMYNDSTLICSLQQTADNYIALLDGNGASLETSTANILITDPMEFELKAVFDATNGSFTLKINSRTVIAYTGTLGTLDGVDRFKWSNLYYNAGSFYLNDIVIANTLGSVNNDWLGDTRVDTLVPTADGTYQDLTRSNTGVDAYTLVDDKGLDDTDYVYGQTDLDRSTFGFESLGHTPSTILGVGVVASARRVDPSYTEAKLVTISDTEESVSLSIPIDVIYTAIETFFEVDPATNVAWTSSGVNALEAGVELMVPG